MKLAKKDDVWDCVWALLLGMSVQTGLSVYMAWCMYKGCQP